MRIEKLLYVFLAIGACGLYNPTQAQKNTLDQFQNWKPRNIGPAGMSGRITTIDAVVGDYDGD